MLKFAPVFQSSAVLQREKPVAVWGQADPGAEVTVTLGSASAKTAAAENGCWKVTLPGQETARGLTLTARCGAEQISCEDIALGEVWLAGGQSNMEFYLRFDADREDAYREGCSDDLRYYCCPKLSYPGQEEDEDHSHEGIWRKADRENLPHFSAVGFYFQKYLRENLNGVPVGILDCSWGGTSASCWMSDEYLTGDLAEYIRLREETRKLDLERELEAFRQTTRQRSVPEMKEQFERMMATPITEPMNFAPTPEMMEAFLRTKYAPFSQFSAAGLYHKMLKPVMPYGIRGFLWYQGEEDSNHPELYQHLFTNMIRCWRDGWGEELPFLFAQLTAFKNPGGWNLLDFVPIRQAQTLTAKTVEGVHMVCTMHVGLPYDIHPKQKRPVGQRLARQALCYAYGQDLLCEAPQVVSAEKGEGTITVSFANCGEGFLPCERVEELKLFVNGIQTAFSPSVSGNAVTLTVAGLRSTDLCRMEYAIADYCEMSLFNSVGHPALPFTAEI